MRFRTVEVVSEFADDPVKGSRFAARIAPVSAERDAATALEAARQRWPDASHHAWAWRLRDGRHRQSDDGEPGGSAGRPILAQLDGHEVVDVIAIVARWFGGTKLGVGGLIRAYGGCAGRALDRAHVVEVVPEIVVVVRHVYDDTGAVQAVVGARGLEVVATEWSESVVLRLSVPLPVVDAVCDEIRDRTSGRAVVEREPGA